MKCGYVLIPIGGIGGSRWTSGGGTGSRPSTFSSVLKMQRTRPFSGREADGAIIPRQPSRKICSPTAWHLGQSSRPGCRGANPTRSRLATERRSATSGTLTFHRQRSRGSWWLGRRPNSARKRYHSAHAVSAESARYIASTTRPRCHRPSGGSGGRYQTSPP